MKLVLKNIGKVQNATVEINGITVIAGENDTGKSTVGKALFSVFNGLYNFDKKIITEREESISNQIFVMLRELPFTVYYSLDTNELAKKIIAISEKQNNKQELQTIIVDTILRFNSKVSETISKDAIRDTADRIIKILSIQDDEILRSVLQKNLDAEFREQVGNVFFKKDSSIQLKIRNENVDISISNNKIVNVAHPISLATEAIYIDDPFVLDELSDVSSPMWFGFPRYPDHREQLKKCLSNVSNVSNVIDEIVTNEKFDNIYEKISTVCKGNVVKEKDSSVRYRVGKYRLDIGNMSTGLKTFAILKSLLTNHHIEMNGTIILDEPEIHLHPEWQLLFAELIVLLHKEFGLHILLNTHSPYFLNATEVYAAKYQVSEKCKYYLTENVDKVSQIEDVTDNTEKIYSKLAKPLQVLENERYRYEGA